MKRYVFKWSAVLTLLVISVLCVYLYTNLPILETPTIPSSPVVGTPPQDEPENDVVRTEFPKAPLLSPFSGCEYLIPLSGSGDDVVLELHAYDDFIFAIGETNSCDYDFYAPVPSVFVAILTKGGMLINIKTVTGTYLHSKLAPYGVGILTACSTGTVFTVFDFDLEVVASTSIEKDKNGMTALTSKGLAFVTTPSSTLTYYDHLTRSFSSVSLSSINEVVSLEYLDGSLYVVANTDTRPSIICVNAEKTEVLVPSFLDYIHCAIPFFDNGIGFVISGLNGDVCSVGAVFFNGETAWSKRLFKADKTYLVPISDGYLLYASSSSSSTCIRLCSHGDVVENCLLFFTNLFPRQYIVSSNCVTMLLASSEYEKSVVATYSVTDGANFKFEFDCTTPRSIAMSDVGITLALSSSSSSGNFSSGAGAIDSFLLGLI